MVVVLKLLTVGILLLVVVVVMGLMIMDILVPFLTSLETRWR